MENRGVNPHKKFKGIYTVAREGKERLATRSLTPGTTVYGEDIVRIGDEEFRVWDPFRSKLAAAILKGLSKVPIAPGKKVLYLGAASGTTVSHVSDIVGEGGRVFCVEFAQRSFRDLVNTVCQSRRNTTPILEDARFPAKYRSIVPEVDVVYSDIAQPDQARIMADNLDMFLRSTGRFLLSVKSRSIDVTREPRQVFKEEARVLESRGYKVAETVLLEPYEMDHCMILGGR